jgi:predicted ATPase
LLAYHYTEAGLIEQAIPHWQQAGQKAIARSAHAEAISHLTKGLEILTTLLDIPSRTQQELDMQTTLGPALMVTKGYAAPEVEQVYARARELCQQVGETPRLFQVLYGLRRFYSNRGDHQTARELAEHYLSLAQRAQDPALLLEAHYSMGATSFYLGEVTLAHSHLEQGSVIGDRLQYHSPAFSFGRTGADTGMCCHIMTAGSLWLLGYPEQALERVTGALLRTQERSHPFTLAYVLSHAALVHQFRREWQVVQAQAEVLIALSTEQGFAQWLADGAKYQGWALATQGRVEEGVAQICKGLASYQSTGAELRRSYFLALLAEAYVKLAQTKEGHTALAEAFAVGAAKGGERFYEAELYRLKGELLLQQSGELRGEAEESFQQALVVARCQQAKSLELRAAISLARLWHRQGKRAAAYDLLAPIYGWFTEGFDTADL